VPPSFNRIFPADYTSPPYRLQQLFAQLLPPRPLSLPRHSHSLSHLSPNLPTNPSTTSLVSPTLSHLPPVLPTRVRAPCSTSSAGSGSGAAAAAGGGYFGGGYNSAFDGEVLENEQVFGQIGDGDL